MNKQIKPWTVEEIASDLAEALKSLMRLEIRGHSLESRLDFTSEGRILLQQATEALAKAKGVL